MKGETAPPAAQDIRTVHQPIPHDSAHKHVAGEAPYVDDIPEVEGTVHACLGLASKGPGRLIGLDVDAVRTAPGVLAVLTAADLPEVNDVSPTGKGDDPVFAEHRVMFLGQPVFAVIAQTRDQARRAAALAVLEVDPEPPVLSVQEARRRPDAEFVTDNLTLRRGDSATALAAAPRVIRGQVCIGGQDHFYLEGQIAYALPGEDSDMLVHSSTQHPSEVQHMVAHVLGVPSNAVTVLVRRMGGAFGGKETQGNLIAAVAALAARQLRRPVKLRLDRDDDMIATGKRHDFVVDYAVGFDEGGHLLAVEGTFGARCGMSADLSGSITDRALFHADNAYYYPAATLVSEPWRTHTVSNTAFRGFGGPQGVVAAERMIEEVAYALGRDPLEIRKLNFYRPDGGRDVTPYHQQVESPIVARLVEELEASSDYARRREAILAHNAQGGILRRGIALTPVKFGISFTATWLNQAGALVHIYRDGSIHLNHGGTEMGQGLNTKMAQVVADAFQVDVAAVKITATHTGKVPNTSATAASSGSDLNGMAALDACVQIRDRLVAFAASHWHVAPEAVIFEGGRVMIDGQPLAFAALIEAAYQDRVHLSAAGFYKTPDIHWDRSSGKGRPFFYFAYGAAVSEATVDTLTGEYQVDRVDILHDVGRSLNPALDRGQVEGGFIQGMGWLTTEELWWDEGGRLRTHAPSTYKIPLASDVPPDFRVQLASWSVNPARTIRRSKAVGEPPLMLAVSVVEALSMAVASVAGYRQCPRLDTPVTPERVLMAVQRLQGDA